MKRVWFNWRYALVITAFLLAAKGITDFNYRVSEMARLKKQRDAVATILQQKTEISIDLSTQVASAHSDAVVAAWAREKGNMALPGDHPVAILAPGGVTPVPTPMAVPQAPHIENWQMWLLLFVDKIEP
jgi:hypothetical protein